MLMVTNILKGLEAISVVMQAWPPTQIMVCLSLHKQSAVQAKKLIHNNGQYKTSVLIKNH